MHISTTLREALQFIAEGATELAGFDIAAISVVDDGTLHTVAVAGSQEAKAQLMRLRTPVEAVMAELKNAERWGPLWFLPAELAGENLDGLDWVPDLAEPGGADAWRPRDLLCGLLYDADGELRGVLSMDVPSDGRRPGPEQRRILQMFARQAEQAVVNAIERGDLAVGMERERAISEYRRQLMDVLSHDLLNTVAAIANTVEMLRMDGGLSERQERGMSVIDRGARMIQDLIEDMRTLVRLGDPNQRMRPRPVDLSQVVRDACDLQQADARQKDVELTAAVADGVVVAGEATELARMVGNLISNAIKYSDARGAVTVTLRQSDLYVEIEVADLGIGISPEDQHRLFEEFFRSTDRRTRQRRGLGLGLTVVRRIVARHRGEIEVRSRLGEGSVFLVRLPLSDRPI